MSPDEINERAWKQMRSMNDDEIWNHPVSYKEYHDKGWCVHDILDLRILVRDYFFNELWQEVRILK